MKQNIPYCKLFSILFFFIWLDFALGGGESSDKSTPASIGSYKTVKLSASPVSSAKYKKPAKGDPVDMAYQFFELNKSLFPFSNPRDELIPTYKAFDNISGVISFQQVYKGVPIHFSDITVRFTGNGELKIIEGEYHSDINLPASPSIDSASAVKIALQEAGPLPLPKAVCQSKPLIIPSSELFRYKENRLYLAWPVRVYPDSTEKAVIGYFSKYYRYYIDALDGSILQKGEDSDLKRESLKPTGLENK